MKTHRDRTKSLLYMEMLVCFVQISVSKAAPFFSVAACIPKLIRIALRLGLADQEKIIQHVHNIKPMQPWEIVLRNGESRKKKRTNAQEAAEIDKLLLDLSKE